MNREQIEKFAIGMFREDRPEFGGVYVIVGLILIFIILILAIIFIFLTRYIK